MNLRIGQHGPGLDLIIGNMYSGKSTELMRRLTVWAEIGFRALYLNHRLDTRGGGNTPFSTHNPLLRAVGGGTGGTGTSRVTMWHAQCIGEYSETAYQEYDVIGIDEGQFFPDLVPGVLALVERLGKFVIVAGLNGDSNRARFGAILDLIPYCDHLHKLNSYCRRCATCQPARLQRAVFTYRHPQASGAQILVGGKDRYDPVCRACYLDLTRVVDTVPMAS